MKLKNILAQVVYESKYKALTKGYKDVIDQAEQEILKLLVSEEDIESIIVEDFERVDDWGMAQRLAKAISDKIKEKL